MNANLVGAACFDGHVQETELVKQAHDFDQGDAAAAVFVVLPEALRFVGLPDHIADPTRRMICGALLLVAVRFRPYGLIPDRAVVKI